MSLKQHFGGWRRHLSIHRVQLTGIGWTKLQMSTFVEAILTIPDQEWDFSLPCLNSLTKKDIFHFNKDIRMADQIQIVNVKWSFFIKIPYCEVYRSKYFRPLHQLKKMTTWCKPNPLLKQSVTDGCRFRNLGWLLDGETELSKHLELCEVMPYCTANCRRKWRWLSQLWKTFHGQNTSYSHGISFPFSTHYPQWTPIQVRYINVRVLQLTRAWILPRKHTAMCQWIWNALF